MECSAELVRKLTVSLPPDIAAKVKNEAKRLDRPASWIVKQALIDWLNGTDDDKHRSRPW